MPLSEEERRKQLMQAEQPLTDAARMAGGQAYGAYAGYQKRGRELEDVAGGLREVAQGQRSFSAEQLRQAAQRNIAGQLALQASGRPGGGGLAARQAAIQAARTGSGLAGQQALAGIAERESANRALGDLLGQMRGQDVSASLGLTQAQMGGLGQILGGRTQLEAARLGQPRQPEWWERALSAVGGGAGLAALGSDKTLKIDLRANPEQADRFIEALQPKTFTRKSTGQPELGVVAQDLEKSQMGKGVVREGKDGTKYLDGPTLGGSLAAAVGRLGERVEKMEDGSTVRRFPSGWSMVKGQWVPPPIQPPAFPGRMSSEEVARVTGSYPPNTPVRPIAPPAFPRAATRELPTSRPLTSQEAEALGLGGHPLTAKDIDMLSRRNESAPGYPSFEAKQATEADILGRRTEAPLPTSRPLTPEESVENAAKLLRKRR